MLEITVIQIAVAAGAVIVGAIIGWVLRARRCVREKAAVNEGWQSQIEAQRSEHERLVNQNKGLMQQVSQYQAAQQDATNRAKELSEALKETFQRRDELQREIKDVRNNLQSAIAEREKLQSDIRERAAEEDTAAAAIRQKEDKILRLSRELENWQNRLPPLIERYRERDREATALEEALEGARERIVDLENLLGSEETRVEPVDREALGEDIDASNDPNNMTQTGLPDVVNAEEASEPGGEASGDATESREPQFDEDERSVEVSPDDQAGIAEPAATDAEAEAESAAESTLTTEVDPASPEELVEDTISPTALVPEALLLTGHMVSASDDESEADAASGRDDAEQAVVEADAQESESDLQPESTDDQADEAVEDLIIATVETEDDEAQRTGVGDDDNPRDLNHHEPRGGLRDNLKLIKGVGPAIEKTLNELGIFRFIQIAEMSEYDIDRVARRLKGFRSRIYREDWIGQARDLQEQKGSNYH